MFIYANCWLTNLPYSIVRSGGGQGNYFLIAYLDEIITLHSSMNYVRDFASDVALAPAIFPNTAPAINPDPPG